MGFKKTSDLIAVSFGVTESGANTFTQDEIALQLDVLNNEIFVVLAADLNLASPDMVAGTNTSVNGTITTTSQTALPTLSGTNTISVAQLSIRSDAPGSQVSFQRAAEESYSGMLDYIALIATNNFFVQVEGAGNAGVKSCRGRVYGYRARADASTYAALVQSEVLSA
tara:strand:+ start:184 stop:687 length:504 start_codon:yes stop_codon:yes gene_type:complete